MDQGGISKPRRRLLRGLPAGLLAASGAVGAPAAKAQTGNVKIVIAGAGLAGLAVAHRLSRELPLARITLVDAKREHNYQPGYTLVATGVWPISKVQDLNANYIPTGVNWIQEAVASFEPEQNRLITQGGQTVPYDWLIVATGVELNYGAIEGMDVRAIGQNGLGSVYPSPEAAQATWQTLDAFRQTGGRAVMTLPHTPIKCAGAPLKMTFLLLDRLKQAGTLERSNVEFHSSLGVVFSIPQINEFILQRWADQGVTSTLNHRLTGVDISARKAHFLSPEGEKNIVDYDFLHVVPPMRAAAPVRNSSLAWQEGGFASGGWLEVDPKTLQHRRFSNVFGVGDTNGTPRGKTAATVKKSVPIVVHNLQRAIAGTLPDESFDGYTSCPLITREGSAMLVEFDYEGRLTPSIPGVDPMQESYFAWVLKYRLLKPAYMAVLKGRA